MLQQDADQSQFGCTMNAENEVLYETNIRVRVFANRDMPADDQVGCRC